MHGSHYTSFTPDEYEHILRAIIAYDAIRGRLANVQTSRVQERWFEEGERLGLEMSAGERDAYVAGVMDELDEFVEGEVWEELAWWIAEREANRRSAKSRDRDAKDVITHRYYHEIMDEFNQHGIDHLAFTDVKLTELSPSIVRSALEQYRLKQ